MFEILTRNSTQANIYACFGFKPGSNEGGREFAFSVSSTLIARSNEQCQSESCMRVDDLSLVDDK